VGHGPREREVVWTPAARECVDEILGYIVEQSPAGAAKVLEAIGATAASLAELSERGALVKELADQSIRELYV
jgi:plasmid stabilization system protein ParE